MADEDHNWDTIEHTDTDTQIRYTDNPGKSATQTDEASQTY